MGAGVGRGAFALAALGVSKCFKQPGLGLGVPATGVGGWN